MFYNYIRDYYEIHEAEYLAREEALREVNEMLAEEEED